MKLSRSMDEPVRQGADWAERWAGQDQGLIACWERGREKAIDDPTLAEQARAGHLVILPWKGGVEGPGQNKQKYGSLSYLAMWKGLRGEDLEINTSEEVAVMCSRTRVTVVFTSDPTRYSNA